MRSYWQDPRVHWVGIDFLDSADSIIPKLEPLCRQVTHAFFTSYVHNDDISKLRDLNEPLFQNFLITIDTVAKDSLQRICLQTGGKVSAPYRDTLDITINTDLFIKQNYGVHLGPVPVPLVEDLPRYDDKGLNFYYAQEDFMFKLQEQRKWSWNIIRPNAIVGFTPGSKFKAIQLSITVR